MFGIFLLIFGVSYVFGQTNGTETGDLFTTPSGDFFRQFEEVTTPNSTSFGAIEKCGEGSDRSLHMCVPYYNCNPETRTLISSTEYDGTGMIDIRFGNNNCDDYLDVCCGTPTGVSIPPKITPSTSPTDSTSPTPTPITPPVPRPVTPSTPARCGIRNRNGVDFKITGNSNREAEFGEFPWMAAILNKTYQPTINGTLAICGGSLIAPNLVLTGAYYVDKLVASQIKVRAGEWDTQTVGERYPYQERDVERIIVHPQFTRRNLFNNTALLVLTEPFDRAPHIGTICLPKQGQLAQSRDCYANGWGKNDFGQQGHYQVILKKIQLPTVPKSRCQELLRQTRLGPKFKLHDSFLCAGGESQDTCTGDGGGPLACPDPNNPERYVLTGMVAWGIGCAQVDVPGVYVDTSVFREWIDEEVRKLSIDPNSYIN